MKKYVSIALAALMLASAFTACAPATTDNTASSANGVAKYTAYLEEHLDEMPGELAVATAETSATYGVDMSAFSDDGYFIRAESGEVVILGKTDAGLDRAVRDYVKNGNSADYFKVYNEGYRVDKLTIAGNDVSEYAIVRDDDADESQTVASSELAKYIALTCGATLPEYTASEYASASDKPARTVRLTVDYPTLGDEAYTVAIGDDGNLTISGGRYRGCLYGVYDLLEDIGWRFVADADDKKLIEYLYESDHVDLTAELNRTESSPFSFRRAYGGYRDENRSEKYKDHYYPKYGAYGLTDVACHGLQNNRNQIFTDDVYTDAYKEGVQPCLTNEEILDCIESYIIRRVESALDAGQTLGKELVYIDLAQWDGVGSCKCNKCRKMWNAEGTEMATWLNMGNHFGQLLKDNGWDELWITLLAYHGTDIAPKTMKPLDNVRISYCFYPWPCMNHSLSGEDCHDDPQSHNKGYHKQFMKWSQICTNNNLDVWYYPLFWFDAHMSGAPILDGIYDSIRYLADHGTAGVMAHSYTANGSALHSLVTYLCAELLWDPYMSREAYYALVEEWFMIVYGESGEALCEYYMMLENSSDTVGCFNTLNASFDEDGYADEDRCSALVARFCYDKDYMIENFDRFVDLFDEAQTLAESEHIEKLIRRYKASMLYTCIGFAHEDLYVNGTDAEREKLVARYEELHAYMKEFNFRWPTTGNSLFPYPAELDVTVGPFEWVRNRPAE